MLNIKPAQKIAAPISFQAIMEWLIENPGRPASHGAAHFRVSTSWWSAVTKNDMFLAKYREFLKEKGREDLYPAPGGRLQSSTVAILDHLVDRTLASDDLELITKAADVVLKAQKVTSPQGPAVNINFSMSPQAAAIAEARQGMLAAAGPIAGVSALEAIQPSGGVILGGLEIRGEVIQSFETVELPPADPGPLAGAETYSDAPGAKTYSPDDDADGDGAQ